jgi:hypothetical protein
MCEHSPTFHAKLRTPEKPHALEYLELAFSGITYRGLKTLVGPGQLRLGRLCKHLQWAREAPGISSKTSDPKSPVLGLFVPKVFGQFLSGA